MVNILPGVIRWPAFCSITDNSSIAAQANLGLDSNFHGRAPWYTTTVSPYKINAVGSQATMDLEIKVAAQAGIKYWAWCWYGGQPPYPPGTTYNSSGLQQAFTNYQASTYKSLIKWCLIGGPGGFGSYDGWSSGNWTQACDFWVTQFQDPQYQMVLGNRPLVYILWQDISYYFAGSYTNTATMNAYLASKCAAVGLGDPYFVIMSGYQTYAPIAAGWPAQAIGAYNGSYVASALPTPFSVQDAAQQANWVNMATVGQVVPNCAVGWDVRPRLERMTPWQAVQVPRANMLNYGVRATPAQMAAHLQAAITYITINPTQCPANTFLTYAWDECDEGSGIIPTLGDPPVNTDTAYITWQSAHGGPAALPTSNMLAAIGAALRGA